MAEYISRKEALENWPLCDEPGDAYQYIKNLPPADVRPVVRGEWIEYGEPNQFGEYNKWYWKCSVCDEVGLNYMHFCPNCGADMREPSKEET